MSDNKQTLYVPENVEFLSKWDGFELPDGIFNKGVTGCGATELAIREKKKTIVCSPRVNLVKNKWMQHKEDAFAVYGDIPSEAVKMYIEKTECPKILTTYDSFCRVAGLIEDKEDWRVVVDEYQYLLIDSSFKSGVEMRLLTEAKQFPHVTYLSATPIADKYMREFDYFKDMPYTELKWKNVEKWHIHRVSANNPMSYALTIIENYRNGNFARLTNGGKETVSNECVIFLNSVTNILSIAKKANLRDEEVNIIIGDNEDNNELLKKNGLSRGSIPLENEPHKMFTFCTSTAFAGCDFYSPCASTFVISDNKHSHTSIDIATELAQIIGRQRLSSNPFRKTVTFIYNVDNGEMGESDFVKYLENKVAVSHERADSYNQLSEMAQQSQAVSVKKEQKLNNYADNYVMYNETVKAFEVNQMAYLSDRFSYDVQHENYINGGVIQRQIENCNFMSCEDEQNVYLPQLDCICRKKSFADKMKEYCEYRQNRENNKYMFAIDLMERQREEMKIYYDALGADRIKALGYKESAIKNEMNGKLLSGRLYNEFRSTFKVGDRFSNEKIKSVMTEVYARNGIKKKGVASHLEKVYGIRSHAVKIQLNDGRRVNGLEFI